jgi:hypothetical protein
VKPPSKKHSKAAKVQNYKIDQMTTTCFLEVMYNFEGHASISAFNFRQCEVKEKTASEKAFSLELLGLLLNNYKTDIDLPSQIMDIYQKLVRMQLPL